MPYTNKDKKVNAGEYRYIMQINRNICCLGSVNTSFRKYNFDFERKNQ